MQILFLFTTLLSTSSAMSSAGKQMLQLKRWAVIGDVLNQAKPASAVVAKLEQAGKTVYKVNPRDSTGSCYRSIQDVPDTVDVIDLIINSRTGFEQMKLAAELNINKVFIQPGAESQELLDFCAVSGIAVHQGCVLREL
uniref:CoA-binding domain-containing protein n=1 Tax=Chrysotila carterae TaxID=13221 RepID=A0A7S4FBQ6_CHRCT|mmetsp:Transcript_35703/g.74976  ORF Transcript_35703/g.74976 Transcript_35703/m.74976 type:complete len:139 (+) Transcript_35703:258-674(+)